MSEDLFSYPLSFPFWKEKLAYWADKKFRFFAFTLGNKHQYPEGPFDSLFFAGNTELTEKELWQSDVFKVGIIGYDFKNQIEKLSSENPEFFSLPELCFFEPELIFKIDSFGIHSSKKLSEEFFEEIEAQIFPENASLS